MKKIKLILVSALIAALAATLLVSCDRIKEKTDFISPDVPRYDVSYDDLMAESYRDYAKEVFVDVAKYPQLADQGLRLVTGYGSDYSQAIEGSPSQTTVIEESFDPQKDILVIINGLQIGNGRRESANMLSDSRLDELEYFEDVEDIEYFASNPNSHQTYDLAKYWKDNGYNVFYFHWEKFADHTDTIEAPFEIQERVWSMDSGVRAVYMDGDKAVLTEPGEAVNGSLSEWFAAEFLRMAAAVNEVFPDYGKTKHDIRFAGHSMGGLLTVASSALLNLLAEAGQLERGFAPNRLALMDSYLGDSGKVDYTISWSGKKYIHPENSEQCLNYVAALKMLVQKFGVAAEFICNEGFVVPFLCVGGETLTYYEESINAFSGMNELAANAILNLCPMIVVRPYFSAVKPMIRFNGHNAVREWYLSSILYDAPTVGNVTVPTATMSDKDVRALRGQYFVMINERHTGCETVRCDDDVFTLNKTEWLPTK